MHVLNQTNMANNTSPDHKIIIERKCNERNISRMIVLLCITVYCFVIVQRQLSETKDVIYGSITLTGEISMNNDLNSKESKKDDDASVPRTLHDQTGQRLHMRN